MDGKIVKEAGQDVSRRMIERANQIRTLCNAVSDDMPPEVAAALWTLIKYSHRHAGLDEIFPPSSEPQS